MKSFNLKILAADSPFYEGPCESLIVPTIRGMRGILADHSGMMSAIVPGKMIYRIPGEEDKEAFVAEGAIKIENNEVLMLVDSVVKPEDIDEERARRAADRAKEAILQKKSIHEYRLAQAKLAREMSRLKVKNREML